MCFPDGPVLKNLPVKTGDAREAGLISGLGNPDPLEKETATHSSILAWKSMGRGDWWGYSPWGCKSRARLSEHSYTHRRSK